MVQQSDDLGRMALARASGHEESLTAGPCNLSKFQMIYPNLFELPNSKIGNDTFLPSENYGKFKTNKLA
jgi:hypothetical protein